MRAAINSNSTTSRYALILEDDVRIPFDIDFDALVASAPKGFGILQLFNSNKHTMVFTSPADNCGQGCIRGGRVAQVQGSHVGYWPSGITGPCSPPECCVNGSDTRWGYYGTFVHTAPCVLASFGFQADSFLYSMAPTYSLGIPLIANGKGGDASTFHQDHVESLHRAAFRRQRQIINTMLLGNLPLPAFVKPACRVALNESQI
eukprot:gene23999-31157_t